MNEDTEVYLELADDAHPDAESASEDTASLLMEVHHRRETKSTNAFRVIEAKSESTKLP